MSRHPIVKWAQRSDKLFITVELPDAKNAKLKLEPEGKFFFSAAAGADNVPYEVDLDLFDKINVDESKTSSTSRHIMYLVKKAEDKWWSRLIKQEGLRPVLLKVDWDKWVDEDEQDSKSGMDMNFGDMDFSKLNMGGGPSDFDADVPEREDDSDTEEIEDRHPTVKWAQRSDKLFITVELPDAKNLKLKLEPEGKFFFSATAGADNVPYEVDLDLFDKINVDESKTSSTSRHIVCLVKKAEDKWWSRLIKQEGLRPVFLKVDWDKWVDEDEQDSNLGMDMDFGDMDFSKLNMGGGPSDFDADVPEGGEDDSDTLDTFVIGGEDDSDTEDISVFGGEDDSDTEDIFEL